MRVARHDDDDDDSLTNHMYIHLNGAQSSGAIEYTDCITAEGQDRVG